MNSFLKKETQKKVQKTLQEKYFGIGSASEIIQEKMKQTNRRKYGLEFAIQSEEVKEKIKQTMKEKYGFISNFQNPEFRKISIEKKKKQNQLKRCSEQNLIKCKNIIENRGLIFKSIEYVDGEPNYHIQCPKCNNEFKWNEMIRFFTKKEIYPYCKKCSFHGSSRAEKELCDYVKSFYNGPILENDRSVLNGKEIDIYLPEEKIAIEFDGIFYHNCDFKTIEKYNRLKEKGIHLIQVIEPLWNTHKENEKKRIKKIIQEHFFPEYEVEKLFFKNNKSECVFLENYSSLPIKKRNTTEKELLALNGLMMMFTLV